MNRRTIETAKVAFMALFTLLTLVESVVLKTPSLLAMTAALAALTGYFVWKRSLFLKLEREESGHAEPAPARSEAPALNTPRAWTMRAVATQLGVAVLALGSEIALFDSYARTFIDAHGGTRAGVAMGLGLRAVVAIGFASTFTRFRREIAKGGARALGLVTAWSLVSGVGFVVAALRETWAPLVVADAVRAVIGLGAAAALTAPAFRRAIAEG